MSLKLAQKEIDSLNSTASIKVTGTLVNNKPKPSLKENCKGFPGGAVVKNLLASAGDMGSSPGPGRSHMLQSNWVHVPQLLSTRATTAEARVPRARASQQEKPP